MLPQVLPQPAHLDMSKAYPSNYASTPHSRPRTDSASFYDDINHIVVSDSKSLSDSPPDTGEDDQFPSPISPHNNHYHYAHHGSGDTANSPSAQHIEIFEKNHSYSNSADGFSSNTSSSQNGYHSVAHHRSHSPPSIDTSMARRARDPSTTYSSHSPSPVGSSKHPSFPQPLSAPHNQDHFSTPPSDLDRFSFGVTDRLARGNHTQATSSDKYASYPQSAMLDRRMSEPAIFGNSTYAVPNSEATAGRYPHFQFAYNASVGSPRSSDSSYPPSLHRGSSTGSLRELHNHQHQIEYGTHPGWKHEEQNHLESYHNGLDEPISPLNPNFSGGGSGSPLEIGLQYPAIAEDHYGPSPPGTGTSTSSNNPNFTPYNLSNSNSGGNPNDSNKTYSFVALPGNAIKKRPRRRYDEIERLYQCSWPDCSKAYGTLNHLNAHVTMQKHGSKRSPNEFKELRKQWRKAKKEEVECRPGTLQRRNSFRPEIDQDIPFYGHHPHHHQHPLRHHASVPHQLGYPNSIAIPGADTRYPIEGIRYPSHDFDRRREEHEFARRASFAGQGSTPATWHPGMTHPSRSVHPHYSAGSHVSSSHSHASMGLTMGSSSSSVSQPLPSSSTSRAGGLPPGSTLLTPLPGYEPPAIHPAMQGDPYEPYDSYGRIYESDGRPSTGHASLGGASADGEYDI